MRVTTEGKRNGIQWTMCQQLDDLDFADDIALISSTQQQMQDKTSLLAATSVKLGLKPNESKTKIMKINAKSKQSIKIRDTILEEVEEFTYLGSIVIVNGGTDADVKTRINKARVIFNILGKSKSSPHRYPNQKKQMVMDWTHTAKTTKQHHKTSPQMEPPRKKKQRKTKEQLAQSYGGRIKRARLHLELSRKISAKQSQMEGEEQRAK
ncbi:uncharacterized protein LOC125647117 [Ostrea edulis]|uniref:uncharacterized protein LOC125647117 n=1 Tax=Ostrea edulis TaxID=37623 RepID=UPI0024AF4848|nr:uncharacterized protein LOC125647117 [Ostrea edulis]